MIINGTIPGDPTEVAKALARKNVNTISDTEVQSEPQEKEKPIEEKKRTVKKGTRKSSKKVNTDESADTELFTDNEK